MVFASGRADPAMLAELLKAGYSGVGPRTLFAAAGYGRTESIRLLIASRTDVNSLSASGESAMFVADFQNKPDAIATLIDCGASVDPPSSSIPAQAAFDGAVEAVSVEAAELLLSRGATVSKQTIAALDSAEKSPLGKEDPTGIAALRQLIRERTR